METRRRNGRGRKERGIEGKEKEGKVKEGRKERGGKGKRAGSFLHTSGVNNTINFRTKPPAFSPDNPRNSSQGVLPNTVIGIVLMVHQPLKPPLRQTLKAYPGLTPAVSSTPSTIKS